MVRIVKGRLELSTSRRFDVLDITERVRAWVRDKGLRDGLLVVKVPHATAAITLNEAERGLMRDIIEALTEIAPPGHAWEHNRIDDNAHAHIAASLVGDSRVIPIENGGLKLGTWQRILLIELDGPRRRRYVDLLFLGE